MGLRAKLEAAFVSLLVATILVVSALEIDRAIAPMVEDLYDAGDLLVRQIFEEVRSTLAGGKPDPIGALRVDPYLDVLLHTARAFGKGVISARVERPDGTVVAASPGDNSSKSLVAPPPLDELRNSSHSWAALGAIRGLWGGQTYELSRPIEVNQKPFLVIKVEVSTALIADRVRHLLGQMIMTGLAATLLAGLVAALLGHALLGPVTAITSGVEQLAEGQDEVRVDVRVRDELGMLAQKFNELSERIRADRSRWEDERGQLFRVFRTITDAVILLDPSGVVLFANDEAKGQMGLPAGGLAEGKALNVLLEKGHPLVRMVDTVMATGSEVRDIPLQYGSGEAGFRLLVSILTLGAGGATRGLLMIMRDLKSVQALEDVVHHSGRLAMLGALVSGFAHQIRNPLNAMSLELELLGSNAADGKPVGERVETLRHEINRLERTVNAMLRLVRPERMTRIEFNLNDLIAEVGHKAQRQGILVAYDLDPHAGRVVADRDLLSEALVNLVNNAVEAMGQGGSLSMSSRASADGLIEIALSDNGKGIPPEILDKIFEPYFTTKAEGTGLGLKLAQRAIDLHQGAIKVESQVGAGTTIRIRIPSAIEEDTAPSAQTA